MEFLLIGAASWVGASLLAGAAWALFHIDVRAREERANAIRADRRQPAPLTTWDRRGSDVPEQQIA